MTDYTITIADLRLVAGITKQVARYNAGQQEGETLTEPQFLVAMLPLQQWADELAPESIPTGEWLQRWTVEERKAARALGTQDAQVQAWLDELDAHATVNLTHASITAGVPTVCAALEQLGVIAPGQAAARAAAIMAF